MILAPTLSLNAGSGAAIVRPTFSRDFAGEKTLNNGTGPAIAFTRGSQATYFTADGTLRFAPHNAIRNSQAGGAVAGTPGTAPTNWNPTGSANGLTREIVGTGTESGLSYIDIRYSGTTTASNTALIVFEGNTQVVAAAGQSWTTSTYCKLSAGSLANASNLRVQNWYYDDAAVFVGFTQSDVVAPTSSFQRFVHTGTVPAGATRVRPHIGFSFSSGVAIDITLRVAAPQLERNVTASDYIPTTGTANFDQPRFDHSGGSSLGLLIEESRQNLFQRSAEFDNAYWTKTNTTVTANAVVAPDGTTTADAVFETVDNGFHVVVRGSVFTVGSVHTLSVFAKANGRTKLSLQVGGEQTADFDLAAVTATPVALTGSPSASIQSVGNGWFRCTATRESTVNANATILLLDNGGNTQYVGDVSLGMYFWGAQAELGAFPTSYIPTTSAAVTRSADSAVVTPISSFYNASEGALFAEFSRPQVSKFSSFLHFDGALGEQIALETGVADPTVQRFQVIDGSNSQANIGGYTGSTANTVYRMAGAYAVNDFAVSQNGSAAATDTGGTLPTVTRMAFSVTPSATYIRKVAYFPRRLSNALLQSLTT